MMSLDSITVLQVTTSGFLKAAEGRPRSSPRELDESQRAVLALPDDASAAVLGAPGTGKTTTLVELIADRVERRGWSPDAVLALAASRAAATRLRDAIALRLARPTNGPLARTVGSLAFEIVGHAARRAGQEPPRLVTGGDQDLDLAGILEGHLELGIGPEWPDPLTADVRRLRGFRTELRELMMRATEFDIAPDQLRRLADERRRPEWRAAADVFEEYLEVVTAYRGSQLDPSEFARFAVRAIREGEGGDRVDGLSLVVVDDLQDATESTFAVLRALAERGVAVVAFGDPDVAVNAFRGAEPDALGRLATVLGLPDAATLTLSTVHRHGAELRDFVRKVTTRIGTAAAGSQRAAVPRADLPPAPILDDDAPPPTSRYADTALGRIEAASPAREYAAMARVLRERHLHAGVPWSQLAVVVRSGATVPSVARALALAEVPTRTSAAGAPLREDSAARALLRIVDVALGRSELTAETAVELLLGPFGGLERLSLRRLRLALRAEEIAGGGTRTSDALLVEGLEAPGRFATIDARFARTAERLASTLQRVRESDGSIEDLLWIAWERSGLAKSWHDQALGTGVTAAEANRNLDGVVALFTAAKRFAERQPDRPAGDFLAEVLDAEIPEDILSPQRTGEAVLVSTPSGVVGLEFDTVVIAALQDGAWPNLRPRGSLLAPHELVRVALGIDSAGLDERKLVLDDEMRMFALAASRARERLVLASVANDDEASSRFFSLLPPGTTTIDATSSRPLSLRGTVGWLRRTLADSRTSTQRREEAAATLAELAERGVPGADPAEWHGLLPLSTTGPLHEGEKVPVSPSTLDKLERSPLDWFLETVAGTESGVVANLGTVLHFALETAEDASVESLWRAVEQRWHELQFESRWLEERHRRIARSFTEALAQYLGDFMTLGGTLVGAEKRFKVEVGEAIVSGSIDRVERAPDGSVVIVDLKTGTPPSKKDITEHAQLHAYQLAYAEGLLDEALAVHGEHRSGGAKLLFVKKGSGEKLYTDGLQPVLDEEGIEGVRERIRRAAATIAASEFSGVRELDEWSNFGLTPRLRLHRVPAVTSD